MQINTTFNLAAILAAAGDADAALPVLDAQMLKADEQIADDGAQVSAGPYTSELAPILTRDLMEQEAKSAADAFNS